MKGIRISFLGVLLALRATAGPVYEQLPGHFGGYDSEIEEGIFVADEFQLNQPVAIGQGVWWGSKKRAFTVRIFADNDGQPGTLLRQITTANAQRNSTGRFINPPRLYPEYRYVLLVTPSFNAQAGT